MVFDGCGFRCTSWTLGGRLHTGKLTASDTALHVAHFP